MTPAAARTDSPVPRPRVAEVAGRRHVAPPGGGELQPGEVHPAEGADEQQLAVGLEGDRFGPVPAAGVDQSPASMVTRPPSANEGSGPTCSAWAGAASAPVTLDDLAHDCAASTPTGTGTASTPRRTERRRPAWYTSSDGGDSGGLLRPARRGRLDVDTLVAAYGAQLAARERLKTLPPLICLLMDLGDSRPGGAGDELAATARRWLVGSAGVEELHQAFLTATVFLQAGDRPGLMVVGVPPHGLVPVWTSEAELARSIGSSAWFSTTGADLLDLLPAGYDLVLDPDGDTALRLRPSALRREPAVTVDWR